MESNMESKKKLSGKEKFAYGIGAVGKDMVYMLSASYISLSIRRCMTLMMASNGWSEQLETGTLTLPIVWAKNT